MFMEMHNGTYCVYVHTNKINGKMYVGQTVHEDNPNERWKNGKGYKRHGYFCNAIQKYGWDNFEHEIIANNLTADEADNFERLLIEKLDSRNPDKGYNLESGGVKNKTHSESTKKKLSESHIGIAAGKNNPMYGVSPKERMDDETYQAWREKLINLTTSDEFRQQMRERNLGKKYSDEVNSKKGRKGADHALYGKHHSEETKKKISCAHIGLKYSDEVNAKKGHKGVDNPSARAVAQYSNDGTFIQKWDYATLASKAVGVRLSDIIACCRGTKGRKTAGGFVWKYANIETEGLICVS